MEKNLLRAFRELGVFLGKKLDAVLAAVQKPQQVELDLTSRAIEKLQDVDFREVNKLIQGLEALANSHQQSNEKLIGTLKEFEKATKDDSRMIDQLRTGNNTQAQVVRAIERLEQKMSEPKNKAELKALQDLKRSVENIKLEPQDIDLSGFDKILKEIADMKVQFLKAQKDTVKAVGTLSTTMQDFAAKLKLEIPSEFRLDDKQFRTISQSGSIGGGGVMAATRVTMENTTLTDADTEYSYTFPANTVSWTIKLRSQNTKLLYAWETGKLPTSGDGSAYATLGQNFLQSQDGVEWSGKTIYLQTDTASQTAEIVSYQI